MLKITGLDKLQRELEDAQRAFKALDGQLATVHFDPEAIRTMESAIDDKVAPYRENAMVASIMPQLKEKYRAAILERAKEGRT